MGKQKSIDYNLLKEIFISLRLFLILKRRYIGFDSKGYMERANLKPLWKIWEDAGKEARKIIKDSIDKKKAETKNA
jgi:hypothetical protein